MRTTFPSKSSFVEEHMIVLATINLPDIWLDVGNGGPNSASRNGKQSPATHTPGAVVGDFVGAVGE